MNNQNKETILLVEDEIITAMAEKMNLENFGYNVLTAHSGENAISIFDDDKIDLILMDIDLGRGIDGTEVAEIILKNNDIPIVFLSSHTEPEIVEKTEKITSYGYVVKNSGITVLDASIKMAFKLFKEKLNVKEHQYELSVTNEELEATNEQFKKSQEEMIKHEVALQASEELFRSTLNDLLIGIVVHASDTSILICNPEASNILGLTIEQLTGKEAIDPAWNFIHEDSTPMKVEDYPVSKVISTKKSLNDYTLGINRPDKDYTIWVNINARPTFFNDGELEKIIINFVDITDQKQAEKSLKKSLQDNKNLLKELQHRAKNSFAMISSMISLMEDSNVSDKEKSLLSDLDLRVKAISEMYDLLYSIDSVTNIRLDEYLSRIVSSLPVISKNFTLTATYDAITVPVKTAIPVGTIVTELITNSIKHAFPENNSGKINLLLKKTSTGAVIEVNDDGTGLAKGFDVSAVDSLGLKLVHALINQIQGNFRIEGEKGTQCVLDFPIW